MSRPLVVTDCDEVLLHMLRHFQHWLAEEHAIEIALGDAAFAQSMRRAGAPEPLAEAEVWALLGGFFDSQMDRQTPIAGAVEAIGELQRHARVVVLTNLTDDRAGARQAQLARLGIAAPVYTNQGPKGAALRRIVAHYEAPCAVFIDDIASHHESAAQEVPQIRRLQFCGEPAIAAHVPCAHQGGAAHARIDRWDEALVWILQQIDRSTTQ